LIEKVDSLFLYPGRLFMSANRRRKLILDPIEENAEEEDIEFLNVRGECETVFSAFSVFFDVSGLLHLIVSGCAIAYLLILTATDDFSEWARFFCRLSQAADYFFYVVTVVLFVSTFSMTALLIQINSRSTLAKMALGVSAAFQAIALAVTTYCIPMSIMARRSVDDFGEWYTSALAQESGMRILCNRYRPAIIFKLVCLVVTGPIVSFFMSRIRSPTFNTIFTRVR
jgi:hypothetical protein